jgi:hypothetical protein
MAPKEKKVMRISVVFFMPVKFTLKIHEPHRTIEKPG